MRSRNPLVDIFLNNIPIRISIRHVVVVMVGVGVGFPYLIKAVAGGNVNFDFINSISPELISILTLLLSISILVVSAIISIEVYKKKEF